MLTCRDCVVRLTANDTESAAEMRTEKFSKRLDIVHPLLGERAGVRADVKFNLHFRPRWMFTRPHPLKMSKKLISTVPQVRWTRRGAASGTRGRVRSPFMR